MSTTITDYAWSGTFGPGADLLFETSYGQVEFVGNAADTNIAVFEQWVHSVSVDGFSAEILTFEQGAHSVSTGRNGDSVTAEGYVGSLDTGNGGDVVTFLENAGAGTVDLGIGDDLATFSGWVNALDAGRGVDTVVFNGSAGANLVDLGDGTGAGTESLTTGGWINEIVQGNGSAAVSLTAGAGAVSLGGGADSLVSLGWVSEAAMGFGDDEVELLGGGTAHGGGGDDRFAVGARGTTYYGEAGDDVLRFDFDALSRNERDTFDGGNGSDIVGIVFEDAEAYADQIDALLAELAGLIDSGDAADGSFTLNSLNLEVKDIERFLVRTGPDDDRTYVYDSDGTLAPDVI